MQLVYRGNISESLLQYRFDSIWQSIWAQSMLLCFMILCYWSAFTRAGNEPSLSLHPGTNLSNVNHLRVGAKSGARAQLRSWNIPAPVKNNTLWLNCHQSNYPMISEFYDKIRFLEWEFKSAIFSPLRQCAYRVFCVTFCPCLHQSANILTMCQLTQRRKGGTLPLFALSVYCC